MSTPHLYLVTGSSRGLGEALARQLLAPDHLVIGIARRRSEALAAAAPGHPLEQWTLDLGEPLAAAEALQAWLRDPARPRWASATLINNAALLAPPGPLQAGTLAELSASLRVGLEAPALLASVFLAETAGRAGPRKLLNISSGLGRRAMAGSAAYCALKAGLDNLSRAIALDEALRPDGARVVSLAPGIIDTDMQAQLRGADPAAFAEQARFQGFKDSGALVSAEATAAQVLRHLARPDFGETVLADVRDA